MPLYFYLLEQTTFHERLRPALTESWRRRSFVPCRSLCAELEPAVRRFKETAHLGGDDMLITRVAEGLTFDRRYWRLLVGELLMVCAAEMPELQTAPDALTCLLRSGSSAGSGPRREFSPIEQAHFGSRDLVFGSGYYRPDHVGWNDSADVERLGDYLAGIDAGRWNAADLAALPDRADAAERAEELDYVREWFPALLDLYRGATRRRHIIICERL